MRLESLKRQYNEKKTGVLLLFDLSRLQKSTPEVPYSFGNVVHSIAYIKYKRVIVSRNFIFRTNYRIVVSSRQHVTFIGIVVTA